MKPYFLRNVLCVGIVLSLLITSVQLPHRQAEAIFVPAAAPVVAPVVVPVVAKVVNTLALIGIYSKFSKEDERKCAQTFPNNSKTQFCISPKSGTLEALIVPVATYIGVVCPAFKQNCLTQLQKKADTFLTETQKKLAKNPVALQRVCPVLLTLVGMTITEYCKANGYDVPDTTLNGTGAVPPKKGSGGGKTSSMGQLPPLLQQIASWVSAAVQRLLENCPAWLKRILPICKEKATATPNTKTTETPTETPTATQINSPSTPSRPTAQRPYTPSKRDIQYFTLETTLQKKAAEKLKKQNPDFYGSIPAIQAMLREIVLAIDGVVNAQRKRPKQSRNFTHYGILSGMFEEYVGRILAIMAKKKGEIQEFSNSFSAPTPFKDYTYNSETSEKFLLHLLNIKPENKTNDRALYAAIQTFTSTVSTLIVKEEVNFAPFFWSLKPPGEMEKEIDKKNNTK